MISKLKNILNLLIIFTLLFAGYLSLAISPAYAAANLYLSPASNSIAVGSNFSVAIRVNTGGDSVNAVQANLSYDSGKLDVVNIDLIGTAFGFQVINNFGGGT